MQARKETLQRFNDIYRMLTWRNLGTHLILGTLITVAIAWTTAATVDPFRSTASIGVTEQSCGWYAQRFSRTLGTLWMLHTIPSSNRTDKRVINVPVFARVTAEKGDTVIIECRGWPWHAMWSRQIRDGPGVRTNWGIPVKGETWNIPGTGYRSTIVIPLGVHWTGFALDAFVFSFCTFVVRVIHAHCKAYLRLRRKQCRNCGYPATGLPSHFCPECGEYNGRGAD